MYVKDTRKIQDKIASITDRLIEYKGLASKITRNIERGLTSTFEFGPFQDTVKAIFEKTQELDTQYTLECVKINVVVTALVNSVQDFEDEASLKLNDDLLQLTQILKAEDFNQNPYILNFKMGDVASVTHKFFKIEIEPITLLQAGAKVAPNGYRGLPQLGFFEEKVVIPYLKNLKNKTFKQVSPKEINATQKHIDAAHGKVLNIGLGMGYFAYMASLKDDVEKVTIIEQDNDLIEFFKEHFLPHFSHREKIEIINSTYYDYLDKITDNQFDFCFIDIDEGTTNIEQYLPGFLLFKTICKKFKKMEVSFFLEAEYKILLTDALVMVFYTNCKKTMEDYAQLPDLDLNKNDQTLFDFINFVYKKVKIKDPSDFDYYINYNTLIKML